MTSQESLYIKLVGASSVFYYHLLWLLDEDKKTPLHDNEVIGAPLGDEYFLQLTETTARITKHGLTCAYVKRFSKDSFPCTKLCDWYIKEVVFGGT